MVLLCALIAGCSLFKWPPKLISDRHWHVGPARWLTGHKDEKKPPTKDNQVVDPTIIQ
jgi:hypothetical protein